MSGPTHGTASVVAALLANTGIAVSKFVAFIFTGSSSMLAESVHSVADAGNQALLLYGGRQARRPADAEHPFGYGRVRYFWAFVVAVVLFTVGAMFALYEGVEKLRHPHDLDLPGVAVGVLLFGIALESLSFRTAVREAQQVRGREGWWDFIRHAKSPELPVILLEDLGALVGLVLALLGVSLTILTGDSTYDAVGTLSIGALLALIAVVLAAEMKSLLIGEGASAAQQSAIRAALESAPDVRRLIHLRTLHLGPEELLVAAKLELRADLGFAEVAERIDQLEQALRAAVPSARVVYLEPAVYSGAAAPGAAR